MNLSLNKNRSCHKLKMSYVHLWPSPIERNPSIIRPIQNIALMLILTLGSTKLNFIGIMLSIHPIGLDHTYGHMT